MSKDVVMRCKIPSQCQKCKTSNKCEKYKNYLKANLIYEHNKLAKKKGYL